MQEISITNTESIVEKKKLFHRKIEFENKKQTFVDIHNMKNSLNDKQVYHNA